MKKAAILAAGEGSRIKSVAPFKPIVKINGTPLLELTLKNLHFKNFQKVSIIFNDAERDMDFSLLPGLLAPNIHYFFKTTVSSMHSLYEVGKKLELKSGEHFFVSMVDSIVLPDEAQSFQHFCKTLKSDESAILVTPYIDDEKPLTVKINAQHFVTKFQCLVEDGTLVTSGVYCFSEKILPLLLKMIEEGHTKMRNFLAELINHNYKIKVFELSKTLDIDHPKDIQDAEEFLQENL